MLLFLLVGVPIASWTCVAFRHRVIRTIWSYHKLRMTMLCLLLRSLELITWWWLTSTLLGISTIKYSEIVIRRGISSVIMLEIRLLIYRIRFTCAEELLLLKLLYLRRVYLFLVSHILIRTTWFRNTRYIWCLFLWVRMLMLI